MQKDNYIYPAIFEYADDGISISFPDLEGVVSCATNDVEALAMAEEALGLYLFELENIAMNIPQPTPIMDVRVEKNQIAQLINIYMPIIRDFLNNQSIKKTLTIPKWMDTQIKEYNQKINLSGILQDSLIKILGLKKPTNSKDE